VAKVSIITEPRQVSGLLTTASTLQGQCRVSWGGEWEMGSYREPQTTGRRPSHQVDLSYLMVLIMLSGPSFAFLPYASKKTLFWKKALSSRTELLMAVHLENSHSIP
jgi:hypothetical protein